MGMQRYRVLQRPFVSWPAPLLQPGDKNSRPTVSWSRSQIHAAYHHTRETKICKRIYAGTRPPLTASMPSLISGTQPYWLGRQRMTQLLCRKSQHRCRRFVSLEFGLHFGRCCCCYCCCYCYCCWGEGKPRLPLGGRNRRYRVGWESLTHRASVGHRAARGETYPAGTRAAAVGNRAAHTIQRSGR